MRSRFEDEDPDTVWAGPVDGSPPLFCFPGLFSETAPLLVLAQRLGNVPVRILLPSGMDWAGRGCSTVEAMGASLADRIERIEPGRALHLLGVCWGGMLAFAAARELAARGRRVATLVMIDTAAPAGPERVRRDAADPPERELAEHAFLREGLATARTQVEAALQYRPGPGVPAPIDLVYGLRAGRAVDRDRRLEWHRLSGGRLRLHPVAAGHMEMMTAHMAEIRDLVRSRMDGDEGSGLSLPELEDRLGTFRLDPGPGSAANLVAPGGKRLPVFPGRGRGFLEAVEVRPGRLQISGWTLDPASDRPADRVAFFMAGSFAGQTACRHVRPDVGQQYRASSAEACGFSTEIELLPGDRLDTRPLRAFAIGDAGAVELFDLGGSSVAWPAPAGSLVGRTVWRIRAGLKAWVGWR